MDSCELVQTVTVVNNEPEPSAESELETEMKGSVHEQVQTVEQMQTEVEQEPDLGKVEQSPEEKQDVSMHNTEDEPLTCPHQELENSEHTEDTEMKDCETVRSAEVKGSQSDGDEKQDTGRIVHSNKEKSTEEDSDEEVALISEDEEPQPSAVCKQKTDSVTQADDESEEEKQQSRSSKRTKQRNPPKPEKSESESDTEVYPPKRSRTKTRKVLENEMVEATKPVRQSSRTKQRKQEGTSVSSAAGSDSNSEVDSGHGSLNSGSSRSTRSKMRKQTESIVVSDGDSKFAVPENPAPKSRWVTNPTQVNKLSSVLKSGYQKCACNSQKLTCSMRCAV